MNDEERREALRAAVHSAVKSVTARPKPNRQQRRAAARRKAKAAIKQQSIAEKKLEIVESVLRKNRG